MRICEVVTAFHSPWQNPFVERLIALSGASVWTTSSLSERHLRRILTRYFVYYHRTRTHLSLENDAPDARPIARPASGRIVEINEVGACTTDTSGRRPKRASPSQAFPRGPVSRRGRRLAWQAVVADRT